MLYYVPVLAGILFVGFDLVWFACLGCLVELSCWWFGFVCLLFVCLMVFGADVCFGIIC